MKKSGCDKQTQQEISTLIYRCDTKKVRRDEYGPFVSWHELKSTQMFCGVGGDLWRQLWVWTSMKDEDLPTCSLILRSSSMRYKVRAALSSVRGSTNTAGSTKPAGKNRRADVNTGMEAARGMTEVWEMKAAGERKKINTFKCVCESLLSLMYLQFIPHVQRLRIAARVCAVFSRQPVIKVVVMLYHRSEQISNFWKHARANKVCSVTLHSLTD